MLASVLLAAALAAQAAVDHNDPQAVVEFLRKTGALNQMTSGAAFVAGGSGYIPTPGREFMYLGADAQGVSLVSRTLEFSAAGGAGAELRQVRVWMERFEAAAGADGKPYLSRAVTYEVDCAAKTARPIWTEDFPQRGLRGRAVKAGVSEHPRPLPQSALAPHQAGICMVVKPMARRGVKR